VTQPPEPPPERTAALAALASQIAGLRGQVEGIQLRMKRAGITGDVDLAERFEELAATVARALEEVTPVRIPAPRWVGIDDETFRNQFAELQTWVTTVLVTHYGGYDLRPCWPSHIHVIWELSSLAAEWQRIYAPARPPLDRALDFYDRYLPNTMRRVQGFLFRCEIQCVLHRRTAV